MLYAVYMYALCNGSSHIVRVNALIVCNNNRHIIRIKSALI